MLRYLFPRHQMKGIHHTLRRLFVQLIYLADIFHRNRNWTLICIYFFTYRYNEEKIVYSPIKLITEEVGVKASVECFNTTCEDEKLMLMLCQYSFTDGYKKAEKINFVPINVISGRTKVESTFTLNDKASEVECMLVKFPMHKIIEKIIYE